MGRPLWLVIAGAAAFLAVDLAFFAANLTKVAPRRLVPAVVAAVVFVLNTWQRGREIVTRNRGEEEGPLRDFVEESPTPIRRSPASRAPASSSTPSETTPLALRANVEHNHVLHECVVIVSIERCASRTRRATTA